MIMFMNIKYIVSIVLLFVLNFANKNLYANLNTNIPIETQNYLQSNGIDSEKLQFLVNNFIQKEYDEQSSITLTPSIIKTALDKSYYYIVRKVHYKNIFKTSYFSNSNVLNLSQLDFWNGYNLNDGLSTIPINSNVDECLINENKNPANFFNNYKPTLQPIVLIDNKLINVFAETVGVLKEQSNKSYILFVNGKNTNLIWKSDNNCPKPKYWSFLNPWQTPEKVSETTAYFCYTCKLIEFSFQIVNIMSNIIFKEWALSILALMALFAGLYVLQEYYNNIENIVNEGGAKKLFIKLGKRILIVVAAISFLFNINGTIIAYVYKPITWAAIAMSDAFISPNRQQSKCGYTVQKEIFNKSGKEIGLKKILPGLTYTNQNILKQSDTTIDLSQDVICSFFRIEEQLRMYIALSIASIGYGGGSLIKSIMSIIIIISFIFMNLLWTLYYVEVVLMIGLAVIAIPFALLGWAIPFDLTGWAVSIPYFRDWRLKILKIVKNGAVKLVMISILTMIIGSFITYIMFGINSDELEKLMLSDEYNKIILMNISEFTGFNLLQTLIGLIVISYILTKIKSWEQDLNSLIEGSSSPTSGLAKEVSTLLKQFKNKAVKGVENKIINKVSDKWKK